MVFGRFYRHKYPMGPLLPGANQPDFMVPRRYWDRFVYKADTPEELAARIGVDPAGLRQSIARMNHYAQTGVDEEIDKGGNANDRYYGGEPVTANPCLAPVEAPYYAQQSFPGEPVRTGGLVTDGHGQVLTAEDGPLAGLCAPDNGAAAVTGGCYTWAGFAIGASMTFGYAAVNHLLGGEVADQRSAGE